MDFPSYNVVEIIRGTTVDGPGFRTSIYLAGCNHNCEGCHNPETHNPEGGSIMSLDDIMKIVREEDFDVTLSGGDPLFNPQKLKILIRTLKKDRRNVWVYTGFTWEDIIKNKILADAIREADAVVDGPFILSLRNTDLRFRGSENQRILDIQLSFLKNKPVIWEG